VGHSRQDSSLRTQVPRSYTSKHTYVFISSFSFAQISRTESIYRTLLLRARFFLLQVSHPIPLKGFRLYMEKFELYIQNW
jgi:hypothetical protein